MSDKKAILVIGAGDATGVCAIDHFRVGAKRLAEHHGFFAKSFSRG